MHHCEYNYIQRMIITTLPKFSLFAHTMKIITFNVNGIKSFSKFIRQKFDLSFNDYLLLHLKADILCLQEVKCCEKEMEEFSNLKDFITITNLNKHKNGIYGVSTIVSKKLYCKKHNIDVPYSDYGRSLLTDHKDFKILNLYCPFNNPNGKTTKEFIVNFYIDIYKFVQKYDDLIVLGDFNACYSVFDHYIYHKEFIKVYSRPKNEQTCKLLILQKFDNVYNSCNSNSNLDKIASMHGSNKNSLVTVINHDICKIFGKHILNCMSTSNSLYINFLHSSLKFLANSKFTFSENTENDDFDYTMELMEKDSYSITEFPFLVENNTVMLIYFYSQYQRKWFLRLILEMNYIDAFRIFHSEYERYTCWNTQLSLRSTNLGTRIDYILIPIKLYSRIISSEIMDEIQGSDHCPVFVNINIKVKDDDQNICKKQNNILRFFQIKK